VLLILRDTREQLPLKFEGISGVDKVEDIGLLYGDYTGMLGDLGRKMTQLPIFFERKSIPDLWGTMTRDYDRFKREMERARDHGHKLILVIEGTYSDVLAGFDRSQFTGESMAKKLATLHVKYDLDAWFCENRHVMARRIVETYLAIDRNWKLTPNMEEAA
jgi:ERCC4-type nuclease